MTQTIGQTIIKHSIRYDLEIIADLIKPNSRVLDIGCSDGELLEFLKNHKNADARGMEISQAQVTKSLMRGIATIQGDAENDLAYYPDQSFDYAILSQTIQATKKPQKILQEMLRIAKYAIISLPNFAHFKNRLHLLFKGAMPVSKTIPYEWYETPNIHFCSIKDFGNLCKKLNFTIEAEIFLTNKHRFISFLNHQFVANLLAEYGIFLITKTEFAATFQEEFTLESALKFRLLDRSLPRFAALLPCLHHKISDQ
jgi:methionine biosynthesis protein MetW